MSQQPTEISALPPRLPLRKSKGLGERKLTIGIASAVILGLLYGAYHLANAGDAAVAKSDSAPQSSVQFTVKRGNLTLSVLAGGTLKTLSTTQIVNEMEKQTKIVWVVDEGTQVKQGDKLIELDTTDLNDQLLKQKIRNAEVEQKYKQAQDDLAIAESKAKSDLLAAENKAHIAELDVKKYKEGDFLQERRKKESAVALAEEELKRAEDKLEWTKRLAEKGYVTQNDLDADSFAVTKSKIQLESAREDLNLLNKFTYERETSKLETAMMEARGDLERVKLTNQREMAIKSTALEAAVSTADFERINMQNLERQIAKAIITAPRDGMVVYFKERYRGAEAMIQVGSQLYPRQRILDLPDFSSWMVEARVHESVIQKIKPGQKCFVTLDAFEGKLLQGTVSKIGVLPDSSDWWREADEYIVQIDLEAKERNFKPGMNAKAEIVQGELQNVLMIPVQAVTGREGKAVVWLKSEFGAKLQEVELGASNERFVEVVKGLEEGQTILMDAITESESGLGARPADRATEVQRQEAGKAAEKADTKSKKKFKESEATDSEVEVEVETETETPVLSGEGAPAAKTEGKSETGEVSEEARKKIREKLDKLPAEEREAALERMKNKNKSNKTGSSPQGN